MTSLGLPPAVFWAMTVREFFAAVDRWNEENADPNKPEPLLSDDLALLMERYPDG